MNYQITEKEIIRNKQVINLAPEFIKKQDGKTKQDCENAAVKRWLSKNMVEREKNQITLLGDDLYSRQSICELALEQGYNFIFVAKSSSHKTLSEWLEFSDKNGEMRIGEITKYEKGQRRIYRYRYVNNVLLREAEPSLMVNWYEVEIFNPAKNKVIYQNSFITNHELSESNIFSMIKSGRTRWKVENETFNTLKNQGYHFEHNFGHGYNHLSNVMALLMLIAFSIDQIIQAADKTFQQIEKKIRTKKRLWQDMVALFRTHYLFSFYDLFTRLAKLHRIQLE